MTIENNNGYFFIDQIIQCASFALWKIDTSMGTTVIIDGSAEFTSPAGIVETVTAIEGHPVIYMRYIRILTIRKLFSL